MRFLALGGESLHLSLLGRFDAITDTPACATFEALDVAYPGSKFILTVRDKGPWLESCRRYWADWIEPYLEADDGSAAYMAAVHQRLYGTVTFDAEAFGRAYDNYHHLVRLHFDGRPEDLLSIDICGGERWEPLCAFLNMPRPRADFPWRNKIAST